MATRKLISGAWPASVYFYIGNQKKRNGTKRKTLSHHLIDSFSFFFEGKKDIYYVKKKNVKSNTLCKMFLLGECAIMEVGCHEQRGIKVSSLVPHSLLNYHPGLSGRSADMQTFHFFSQQWLNSVPWQEGLRTLCVAYRPLSPPQYQEVCNLLNEAKLALQDRDKRLAEAYDLIEKDLILLGATAVEDR